MDSDWLGITQNTFLLMQCFCGRWGAGGKTLMWLTEWSEQKKWKVKKRRRSEVWAFSSHFLLHSGWRLQHGNDPDWRSVKPLRLRGEEMTGLPQAPLCSSNGLLRWHGGVRNIISSYSPHETFFFFAFLPFSGVAFQIPQWLHLFYPKNQSPISEIKGDYTAH